MIRKVLSKARAGTIVTFIPGNHDEYLRRFCDLQLGNILVTREAVHRTADGRLPLIPHGDEFDGITRCHRGLAKTGDVGPDGCLEFPTLGVEVPTRLEPGRQHGLRILLATDAWPAQVNGVTRTRIETERWLQGLGHRVLVLELGRFRTVPCPPEPSVRLAVDLWRRGGGAGAARAPGQRHSHRRDGPEGRAQSPVPT